MGKIQSKVIRLEKLLLVQPYRIVGLWSNGETRINDFSEEINEWRNGNSKELKKLTNSRIFKTAFIKNGTLAFAGVTVRVPDIDADQPIDFDRRKLYSDSQLIGNAVSYEDVIQHKKKRSSRQKRPGTLPGGFQLKSNSGSLDLEPLKKISQRLGAPVTPLIVIGDQLIELE